MPDRVESIEKLERDLWEAADNLRATANGCVRHGTLLHT